MNKSGINGEVMDESDFDSDFEALPASINAVCQVQFVWSINYPNIT